MHGKRDTRLARQSDTRSHSHTPVSYTHLGPFVCELFGDEGHALREAGGEYGAATGRPRRVGGFDVVASRYGVKIQGATDIA